MKNTRTKQTPIQRAMKIVTSITLLAMLFVLVLAGTLSGAFGVEENLVQNGKIEGNVASAEGVRTFQTIDLSGTFKNTTDTSININPDVAKRGGLYTTDKNHLENNTWVTGDASTGGKWYLANNAHHSGDDFVCAWFVFDLGADYASRVYGELNVSLTGTYTNWNGGGVFAIESGNNLIELPTKTSDGDSSWYNLVKDGKFGAGATYTKTNELKPKNDKKTEFPISLTHTVSGRYVRIHYATYDPSWDYNEHRFDNVKVTLSRKLAYYVDYDKNSTTATGTVVKSDKLEYFVDNTISNDVYVGNKYYFDHWNTKADNTGVNMAVGATTGTNTNSGFGKVVKDNLQAGITTTTLYAQWNSISFVFNRQTYSVYNGEVLQVLQGHSDYLSSTVSSDYTSTITYKTSSGTSLSSAPTTVGNYIATITVSKGSQTRGAVDLPFAVIEGDFGKLPSGTSGKWGSETNPYVISTTIHLENLSGIVNGTQIALNTIVGSDGGAVTADDVVATDITYANCYFVVTANITVSSSFERIAKDNSHYFKGNFNGQNHIIGGLNCGLFGYVGGGTFKDLTLQGSVTSNTSDYYGGLIGYATNITVSGVTNEMVLDTSNSYVGGLIGFCQNATIENCHNKANVSGIGNVGGIVGFTGDTKKVGFGSYITNCTNIGNIFATGNYVGGIVGWARDTYFTDVANSGDIKTSGEIVGGISSRVCGGSVTNAQNSGNVEGTNNVGGITGHLSWATITNVSNSGKIIGNDYVGGLVGKGESNDVSNFLVKGTLSNTGCVGGRNYVGGIAGYLENTTDKNVSIEWDATVYIENCTFGDSSGDGVRGTSYMGGAIGFLGENITISGSISVSGCDIDNENGGNYLVGGAIGYNAGTVSANISVTARVISRLYGKVNNISGAFAGGIVGYNAGTLSGELNRTSGDVLSVAFNDYVGGLVGYNSGAITGKMTHTSTNAMYENATVYGATKVGGLVGYTSSALNISNAQNTGNIVGSVSVGGLVGYADAKCTINASTNTGSVSGTNNVGGLVGYAKGIDLSGVSNSATINGYTNVGGLVGNIEGGAAITTSGNSGAVNGYKHLGGFVGYAKSSGNALSIEGTSTAPLVNGGNVTSTIPSGSSSANNDGGVAGFVGYLDGDSNITISHCVNNGEIHGLQFNGIAGILGYVKHGANLIYINNCKNTELVEGGINTGGIGGRLSTNSSAVNSMVISHCYNSGEILTQDYSTGSTGNSGTTGGICGYFNATSTTAAERTAVISYCYNVGNVKIIKSTSGQAFAQNDSNKGFIGGIVGNAKSDASNPDTNGKVAIEYCYVDLTSGHSIVRYGTDMTTYINGTNLATVSATSYVIKKGTSITAGNSGSYLVYNEYTTTFDYPLVDGTQTTWENILTQNINGFRLTTNVADGYYYASLKGVGGELLTPDNLEVAGTSPYTVNAKYYVDNANGNIFVGTTEIVVNQKTETYKAAPLTIDNPSLPSGYDFKINYFDTADYSGTSTESKTNAGTYYTETLVKIGDKVVGRLKDSTKGILTINKKALSMTWTPSALASPYTYNAQHQGITNVTISGFEGTESLAQQLTNTVFELNVTNLDGKSICTITKKANENLFEIANAINVGLYGIKVELVNATNYTLTTETREWEIIQRELTFGNTWTDGRFANQIDRTSADNFIYNGNLQGLAYNGIAINNRINTVPVIKNENGTNVNENGIFDVTYTNSDPSGYGFAYKAAGTYFRKYTLVDKHNYTIAGHANGIVEYKWTIAKNRLTVANVWSSDNVGDNPYGFIFNGENQGVTNIIVTVQPDTQGVSHDIVDSSKVYSIENILNTQANFVKNQGTYLGEVTVVDTVNYMIGSTVSYVGEVKDAYKLADLKGVTKTDTVVTYNWEINRFDVGNAFANKKAWFGAGTDMVVSNQNTEKVNGTEFAYYYLQAAAGDSPKVIVYQNGKYIKDNFVLYVQYTTITNSVETHSLVKLAYGTDYNVADLGTAGEKHVNDVSVTASGTGNFVGDAVKYYVVADSDFGGNVNQAGWGSESNPYVIEHESQLLRLSQIVNGGVAWNSINGADGLVANTGAKAANRTYEGCYFVVKANIKLLQSSVSGIAGFEPIGSAAYQFKAAQFAKDTNLATVSIEYSFSDTAREYVGLFGYIDGTSIVGIDVVGVGTIKGNKYVGGIVGYANGGKINNCSFSLKSLSQDEISGSDYVGGIVGYANGTAIVSNSDKFMQSKVNGASYVGGIAGEWIVTDPKQINDKSCILTYAANIMIVGSGSYVGGIAGKLDASNCENDLLYNAIFTNGIAGIGSDNVMSVYGTSYVGALFGAFVGNGYHDTSDGAKAKSIILVNNANAVRANVIANDKGGGRVIGGLVGYAEKVGILFGDNYVNESMVVKLDDVYVTIAKTGVYVDAKGNTSFVGGIVGVLGENATIESVRQTYEGVTVSVGTYSVTNKTQLNGKDFVGGIAGYIANTAGTYFGASAGETNNIIGNSIQFFNEGAVSGENFVGGIIGGIGVVRYNNPDLKIEYSVSGDTLLNGLLDTDENEKINIAYAPLESDMYTQAPFGKIVNVANVTGSGNYVGGLFGYVGSKTRLALVNKQMSDNTANLDNPYAYLKEKKEKDTFAFAVYNGDSGDLKNVKVTTIQGSRYVGGFVGFLNIGSHEFGYAVNKAKIVSTANDKAYVGGFVGYMVAGTIYGGMSVAYEQATAATNAYQGKEYVGGFVGYVVSATIRNSISTGFKFSETSVNKSGIIGNGLSFTIEGSWTIYIADNVTEKSVSGNTTKGRYLVVDSRIAIADNTAPKLARMAQMVGFNNVGGIETKFNFDVNVPPMENKIYQNNQLVFYDVSGNDHVSGNTFEIFENRNNVLTMQLSMAQADSMIVTLRAVEFSNIPDCKDSNKYNSNAQQGYKKPSASDLYSADVIHSTYNSDGKVIGVWANLYFTANGKSVVVGAYQRDGQIPTVGNKEDAGYIESFEPGSAESPYIINTQEEWNEFAHSVYSGKKYVTTSGARQYVRLTKDIVINANGHVGTDNNSLDFTNNGGYNFAGDFSQDNANSSFQGEFDGNGHTITVTFAMNQANRASVFPNASGAVFRNLTIAGKIQSASQANGANDVYKTAGYDVAGFVGKAFGSLEFYNCKNDANIIGLRNVAGIVGYYNSSNASITMTACVNTGNITSLQGTYTEGGFKDRYSYNDNIGESGVGVNNVGFTFGTGGIIGAYTGSITIESCRNTGEIIGGHNVGGIIGLHDGVSGNIATLTIKNCANTGHVLVNSGYWGADEGGLNGSKTEGVRQGIFGYAGGIVGLTGRYSILKMYASYNTGEVVAYSNIAGGLVGAVGPLYQPKGEKNKVLTGGRSSIVYCYNTGEVKVGGTFPKYTQTYDVVGREFYGGSIGGGFVGIVGDIQISQSYNAGNVWQFGIIAYGGSWQVRAGGIVGQSQPAQGGYVLFDNLYNVGTIYVRSIEDWITIIKTWYLHEEARYGSAISPYCDTEKDADRIYATQCYSINNCVSSHIPQYIENTVKNNNYSYYKGFENESSISWANSEAYDEYYRNSGVVFSWGSSKPKLVQTGLVYDTYDSLTGAMSDNGSAVYMTGDNFAFSQSTSALTEDFTAINATYNSTLPIIDSPKNDGTTSHTVTYKDVSGLSWTAYPDSWLYVYGCLPQLSLFALDTQNGLSMRSVGYGKDIYGEFNKEPVDAGKKEYPYIIKDGIDLLGMQALVDSGYTFDGKYIEFANATNNLDKIATKVINMPTSSLRQDVGTTNDFMSSSTIDGNYEQKGKSYHLYTFGALCNQARNKNATFVGTDFSNWKDSNHFYSQSDGKLIGGATFATVNFLPIGRYGADKVFKGSISGKQADGTNTEVANLRILTSGTDHAFAGLFARAESAEISYITVSGDMRAYATNSDGHSAVGGIVADSSGDTIIDHCNAGSGSAARELKVFAYGKKSVYEYNNVKDLHTYAGGIVGVATTSFYKNEAHVYESGTASIIRNCEVVNATVMSVKNNIGGIVGYVDGQAGAKGMNNKLEITGNTVTKAELTAIASDSTISDVGTKVGGILGYSDQYVAVIVSGCTVGTNSATKSVTIKGENAIGGIVGALPSNINEIKDCYVLQSTFIERGKWGVVENVKDASGDSFNGYGTAIGGIIGYAAFDTTDNTGMSVTTTISGNIVFNGNIIIAQPTNKGTGSNANNSQDGVVRNVGGVFGDMTSGASFATGANIKVNGTITVSDTINEVRNIGGVAGRTKDVAFSGSFEVGVNIVVPKAYNVGGFIGSNSGIVNVLSDNTTIRIGAHLSGAHDVGGFVGNNRSGAILMLGANIYRSTRYEDPLSINVLDSAQISALNDNVGGIVGGNDDGATLTIVKGDIQNAGHIGVRKNADGSDTVSDAVGGIVGSNKGTLATGGGIGAYKALTINNSGTVIGRNYVGGVFGLLHGGSVAGTFTNIGDVTGEYFVGGSIGYVSYAATITALGNEDTKFENGAIAGYTASGDALTAGDTAAQGVGTVKGKAYVGGSIGIMLGKIVGNANAKVVFTSSGIVDASDVAGYLGGSIGVIAGQVDYAQFISTGELKGINAITAVGGSVGFIGAPTPLLKVKDGNTNCTEEYAIDLGGALFNRVHIKNSHFESNGASLVLTGTRVNEAKYNGDVQRQDYEWGGVGGAIGVIAGVANGFDGGVNWANNTYYAQGSVTAPGVYNVGGIVGFIRANNITINNMLAYDIDVTGGSNVGGIIGFTEGEKTVIANAFAISTTDSTGKYTAEYTTPNGTKVAGLAGGIIGKAADDTDASTSYWVKGYKNADLAGTNVNDLKNTLGRYTAITETIGQTTIIFTKELIGGTDVAEPVYPTPYEYLSAYYGENDKHTVNGKTLTIADTFEYDETTQVTTYKPWDWYFTEYYKNVSTDSTVVKTQDGTWVYAKNTWAQYSTGTSQTGWYFVYANDAAGDEGNVGTVNAKHTATSSTQGEYTIVDRDFWKRIANAYTASEKEKGLNDPSNANYKLNSDIVLNADEHGNKAPLVNNLYATATAATKSGYYLYIASSGESRPTAKSDGGKFYIQINTVDVDNAKESAKLAKNVAVYYRSIAMGSALTYNGYNRYAPISLQKDIKSEPSITDGDSAPAKKNTYAYTTALVEPQTVAKTVGTYKSNVFVYYYDDTGTAYKVGGITQGAWKIKQRTLTFNATSVNNKVYGDKDIESKVTIQNVAPNDRDAITFVLSIKGVDTPITISDLKAGKSYLAKDYQGIEITLVTASQDGSLSGADANFIAETITDKSTYKIEFNIKFTNAKKYEISTSLADGLSKTNYVMSNSNQNVEVKKRGIDVKIDSDNKSAFFDGKYTHGTTWTFSNIADEAFGDTWQSVLKAFSPLFVADIEKEGGGYNPYTSDLVGKNSLTYNKVTLQYDGLSTGRITFTGAGDVGNYYLRFSDYGQNDVNNTSNYYIKLTDGESESYAVSKNMLNITWSRTNNGTHVYDKSTIGTITASVVADHGIENLKSFVETYFTREWGRTKGETDIIVTSSNNTTATITFKTLVNAGTYTAKLTVNKQTHQDKINCSYTFKNGTTFSYEIEKRTLLVSFDYAGEKGNKATGYIYTTRHQGLNGIKVDNLITGQNGDTVGISIVVAGENVVYQYNTQSQDVSYSGTGVKTVSNISTIDVGKYHVTATLSSNANYQLSPTTDSWEIKKYSISLSGLTSSSKIYDGIPFKPTVYINNNATTNGEVPYEDDLITVNYKATSDKFGNGFVNKGEYTVSIGKGDITAKRKNTGSDTTLNYDVTANQSAKFIINPRTVTLTWETIAQFVYNTNKQGLKVSSASSDGTGSKVTLKGGGSITACQITGYAGGDEILLNLSGAITNVTDGKSTMTATIDLVSGENADGSLPSVDNYVLANATSGEFEIIPSILTIKNVGGSTTKVYDATTSVTDTSTVTFDVESSNKGDNGSKAYFTFVGIYDDKNVGVGKTVTLKFTFTKPTSGNYIVDESELVENVIVRTIDSGSITPKELNVKLDKLRSGKATRVYNGTTTYGGAGAMYSSGTSARSVVYRSGEGFVVDGFPSAEQSGTVTISAVYKEADAKRGEFDSYVNFVYGDDANGYQKGTVANKLFKTLVFSISGACAQNYTFKVTNGTDAYSGTVGNADQSVTVYDSRDEQNKDKRPSGAGTIYIEITVKSFKVEYTNTSQSYANSDNTYNTDWKPVEAIKTPDGTTVTVLNGWMMDESGNPNTYNKYTVIRGRMGSTQLSAQVSGEKGMEHNYNMSNQPILTIGYFVDKTDFEVGSIASLMIASYYWYASQHADSPDFTPIVSAGSEWVSIVTNDVYGTGAFGESNKPADAPKDCNSWDEYFAYIEKRENVTVFLNEYEKNSWGYYKTTQTTTKPAYTSYMQTADFTGIVKQADIEILNNFFTTYTFGEDGTAIPTQHTWGNGGKYITNFLKPSVGNVLTALGSVFVSTDAGFGGMYNGNGYVIEYLNIYGFGGTEQNVGMFDKIGNGSVSGLHLRNVTISANGGNVGGIAGEILADKASSDVTNVSFHGSITVSGSGNVGGLFGKSARNIDKAIVLGSITANGGSVAGVVGVVGVVGSLPGTLSKVVSLMQVDAFGTVAPIANGGTVNSSTYLANAVWSKDVNGKIAYAGGNGTAKSYAELMGGSTSGYGKDNKYYYAGETPNTKGDYDVIDDVLLSKLDVDNNSNPRQSMRLRDIVDVYLLMYSLSETTASGGDINGARTYTISTKSWLVGEKHGTSKADAIVIANKQNIALLRQLRFATFVLMVDLTSYEAQSFGGAFYGTIYQNGYSNPSEWLSGSFADVTKATIVNE